MNLHISITALMIFWCATPIVNEFSSISLRSEVFKFEKAHVPCVNFPFLTLHSSFITNCVQRTKSFIKTDSKKNVLTRRFIILSLLRGCIEANPGPGKKRKTQSCTFCGRFKGNNTCSCENVAKRSLLTFEDEVNTIASQDVGSIGNLYSPIVDSIVQQPVQERLTAVCLRLGIPFSNVTTNLHFQQSLLLVDFVPDFCHVIGGDGNCLFASFCVALGSKAKYHAAIRMSICNYMQFTDIPTSSLEAYVYSNEFQRLVPHNCSSVADYLEISRMQTIGVYGSCPEVFTFAQLAICDVYVYHCLTQSWIAYFYAGDRSSNNVIPIYLRHNLAGNHFDVVSTLKPKRSLPLNVPVTQSTSFENNPIAFHESSFHSGSKEYNSNYIEVQKPSAACVRTSKPLHQTDILPPNNLEPFDVGIIASFCNSGSFSTDSFGSTCTSERSSLDASVIPHCDEGKSQPVEECAKCRRKSTEFFPLTYSQISSDGLRRTKFGFSVADGDIVCQCCFQYVTETNKKWCFSWPAVLSTIIHDQTISAVKIEKLYSHLPDLLRDSWSHRRNFFNPHLQRHHVSALLVDITERRRSFNSLIESGTAQNLEKALDEESYPNCRCPFGCFTFVDQCGGIGFNHLINSVIPDFTSFDSSSLFTLRGARPDWTQSLKVLDTYSVSGFTYVDITKGLVIGTCIDHNNGSSRQFLHPPRHPSLQRLSVPIEDRLALVVPTLRMIKNAKANYASHTYQLLNVIGNYTGISSIRLTTKRCWRYTSDLLRKAESQCSNFRRDVNVLLDTLVRRKEITSQIKKDTFGEVDGPLSRKCLQNTTSLPLKSSISLSSSTLAGVEDFLRAKFSSVAYAHGYTSFGAHPPSIDNRGEIKFILNTLFSISPVLCDSLATTSNSVPCLKHFLRYLEPTVFFSRRNKKANSNFHHVLQVLNENSSMSFPFMQIVETLAGACTDIYHRQIMKRATSTFVEHPPVDTNTRIIMFSCSQTNSLRTKGQMPLSLTAAGKHFELCYVASVSSASEAKVLVRHGGIYNKFWLYEKTKTYPVAIPSSPDKSIDIHLKGYWNLAVFYNTDSHDISHLRQHFSQCLTGKGNLFCPDHSILLTRDFPSSGYFCACGKQSFLRCPVADCCFCLCKKDTMEASTTHITISKGTFVAGKNRFDDSGSNNSTSEGTHKLSASTSLDCQGKTTSSSNSQSDLLVDGGVLHEDSDSSHIDNFLLTDSGVKPMYASKPLVTDTDFNMPLHVLLNGFCGLLKRKNSRPIYVNARKRRLLENITATSPDCSVPLLHPEAMLFPTIFWKQTKDFTYPGAISASLFNNENHNRSLGFAGLDDMMRTRIKDSSLLTSSDPRYIQYAFDSVFNLQLRGKDSRIVLNRGWAHASESNVASQQYKEGSMFFDQSDSRKNVNELSSALKEEAATYFFTYTCSQSTHPGVRKIFEALQAKYPESTTPKEIRNAAVQAEMVTMLRAWERSSRYVMKYIQSSHEAPLGTVRKLWYRYEFQNETSAFPHIHALIWTSENVFSDAVRQRVCCSLPTFLGNLCNETIWSSMSDEQTHILASLFEQFQTHNCRKAKMRCHKKTDNLDQSVCRVPAYPSNMAFSYKVVEKNLSVETWDLFKKMSLAFVDGATGQNVLIGELQGGKHHYPSEAGTHFSPTNASIFALVRSSTNLQICDTYMSARYLAKYAAGVEERSFGYIHSSGDPSSFTVGIEGQQNEKIAGVRVSSKCNNKFRSLTGRVLSLTESAWWLLRFPYVVTNIAFVHVVTAPKEKRAGIVVEKSVAKVFRQDPIFGKEFLTRKALQLPPHRQFTRFQEISIVDAEKSPFSNDKITVFSVRPPELLFIRFVEHYFTWFTRRRLRRNESSETLLSLDTIQSQWIDGLGYKIKINPFYLNDFREYCNTFCSNNSYYNLQAEEAKVCISGSNCCYYVDDSRVDPLVQVVFSTIVPRNSSNFLIHLLLSLGQFTTEMDLFSHLSLKSAFAYAGLIRSSDGASDCEILQICRHFIMSQLRFYPGSATILERYTLASYHCLCQALKHDCLTFVDELPLVLQKSITGCVNAAVLEEKTRVKRNLITALLQQNIPGFPNFNQLMGATMETPLGWRPRIRREQFQTSDSIKDQRRVFNIISNLLNTFGRGDVSFIKHQFIIGPPGTGKSYVLLHCLGYALSKGFSCRVTSLAAERASMFGGIHINALIPFPVSDNVFVTHLVTHALQRLSRDPIRSAFLQHLQVLFIEEVSMVSAELWSAVDSVFQVVCDNNMPFGGKLLICSGDFLQLPPPSGTILLRSNTVLTCFCFHYLKFFVRTTNAAGQRLLTLLSEYPSNEFIHREILDLIDRHCTFVPSWHSVPSESLRVFATRLAEQEAITERIDSIEKLANTRSCHFTALDEMTSCGTQNWIKATSSISGFLNRVCPEPEFLFVHEGAVLRLTCNLPQSNLHQGQLCVVNSFDIDSQSITVKIAPPGYRILHLPRVDTLAWPEVVIRKNVGVLYKFHASTVCRRLQFPLKMYVASTVHKVMGDTLPMLSTQITEFKKYKFWTKEQLYVLLSRVRDLSHVTFVGDKTSILDCIKSTLHKEHHLLPFIVNTITSYTSSSNVVDTSELLSPFPIAHADIPAASSAFCYLLRSLKFPHLFYIGRCKNLRRRLREHNSGHGAPFTSSVLRRPWAVVAYVHGFHAATSLESFEADWQKSMKQRNRDQSVLNFLDYFTECSLLMELYRCNNIERKLRCQCLAKLDAL